MSKTPNLQLPVIKHVLFGLRKLQLQIKELELSYFNDHYLVVVSGLSLMEFSPDMVPILTRHTAQRGNGFRQLGQA